MLNIGRESSEERMLLHIDSPCHQTEGTSGAWTHYSESWQSTTSSTPTLENRLFLFYNFPDSGYNFVLIFLDAIARKLAGQRVWGFWRIATRGASVCIYSIFGMLGVSRIELPVFHIDWHITTIMTCLMIVDGTVTWSISAVEIYGQPSTWMYWSSK